MKIEPSPNASAQGNSRAKNEYFTALESWRGVAATMVVIGHICWINPLFSLEIVRRSYLMVDFFFILSGFVIALNYEKQIHNAITFARFMWLRFWRLYPLHFAFLIVFVGIEFSKYFAGHSAGLVANHPAFSENNLYAFVMNVLLLQGMNTTGSGTFNGQSWSISTEFYAYVVFAVFVISFRTRVLRIVFAAVLSALCFYLIHLHGNTNLNFSYDFGFVRCVAEFFLGVIAYYLYGITKDHSIWHKSALVTLLQIASVAVFIVLVCIGQQTISDFYAIIPLFFVIFFFAVGSGTPAAVALSAPPARWLGRVSYSIYMTHDAVLWILNQILRVVMHVPNLKGWPREDQVILNTHELTGTIFLVLAITLVMILSNFTFKYIEEPWRKWSRTVLADAERRGWTWKASSKQQSPREL
jgi:peptidoglycan/LPS O-acetylase OafA/YrhL